MVATGVAVGTFLGNWFFYGERDDVVWYVGTALSSGLLGGILGRYFAYRWSVPGKSENNQ